MRRPGSGESWQLLKRDAFGATFLCRAADRAWVRRDIGSVRWWLRPLARAALRRERRTLGHLRGLEGIAVLLGCGRDHLERSLLAGATLAERPPDLTWFRRARQLLQQVHRRGVAHNDLAKEENWLVLDDRRAALIDFQLAFITRPRSRWLRLMAREDLRHLLKHKVTFHPEALTPSERRLISRPSRFSRAWRKTVKRAYNVLTRRLLRWRDDDGRGSRRRQRSSTSKQLR